MKYTLYGETKCSWCGVISRTQHAGDGCHACLRGIMQSINNGGNTL